MTHELIPSDRQEVAREAALARLAERANLAHNQVAASLQEAVAQALEAGRALLEAREILPKGKFTAWLKANFKNGLSTARNYVRFVVNWNRLGADLQRAGGLSQRQITRMLKGLPCSDGRANPRAAAALPAPVEVPSASERPVCGNPSAEPPRAMASSDPLEFVAQLLEQAVAELRRLSGGNVGDAPYARHLLQPLESIRQGIPTRRWFWDMVQMIES